MSGRVWRETGVTKAGEQPPETFIAVTAGIEGGQALEASGCPNLNPDAAGLIRAARAGRRRNRKALLRVAVELALEPSLRFEP